MLNVVILIAGTIIAFYSLCFICMIGEVLIKAGGEICNKLNKFFGLEY